MEVENYRKLHSSFFKKIKYHAQAIYYAFQLLSLFTKSHPKYDNSECLSD
jgi:hypothetical protein